MTQNDPGNISSSAVAHASAARIRRRRVRFLGLGIAMSLSVLFGFQNCQSMSAMNKNADKIFPEVAAVEQHRESVGARKTTILEKLHEEQLQKRYATEGTCLGVKSHALGKKLNWHCKGTLASANEKSSL